METGTWALSEMGLVKCKAHDQLGLSLAHNQGGGGTRPTKEMNMLKGLLGELTTR